MCFYRRRDISNSLILLADKHHSKCSALSLCNTCVCQSVCQSDQVGHDGDWCTSDGIDRLFTSLVSYWFLTNKQTFIHSKTVELCFKRNSSATVGNSPSRHELIGGERFIPIHVVKLGYFRSLCIIISGTMLRSCCTMKTVFFCLIYH